jgi:TonB-linked outer membrane protein, SusC/RagA family
MGLKIPYIKTLILFACLISGTSALAQTVTIKRKNATLLEVLRAIEKQTAYGQVTDRAARKYAKPRDIDVTGESIDTVLARFCRDQPLIYTITDRVITVRYDTSVPFPEIPSGITIVGRIVNEKNEPVPGATVAISNSNRVIATNDEGEFILENVSPNTTLVITSVNYESKEVQVDGEPYVNIQMIQRARELTEVSVVSTGYQDLVKERSPGSYAKIDNRLFNRRVSTNVLDRLDGVTPGMIFNKNIVPGLNQSKTTIRGRSTIFSNAEPLVVVDNFPYPGDISNINPNDIENVTVLKDANAAAIWGAFAGNGVIVINTKKGRFRQEPTLTVNSNITIGAKPDAYYLPALSTEDYIWVEQYLFEQGFYAGAESGPMPVALSPVVELFIKKRDGFINDVVFNASLDSLRSIDIRREKDKYFYRNSLNQQYAINTTGGGANHHYYLSIGLDKNLDDLVGNHSQRLTINANNTYSWFNNRLTLYTGFAYSESTHAINNDGRLPVNYPYLTLGDKAPAYFELRQSLKEQAWNDGLLDWNYRPLEEILLSDHTRKIADSRMNVNLNVRISKAISAKILYQYNKGRLEEENFHSTKTYFTRNIINRFTQVDSTGNFSYPIPKDKGISDQINETYDAQNIRLLVDYSHNWEDRHKRTHDLSLLAGAEVRNICMTKEEIRLYGYNKGMATSAKIDTNILYPQYHYPAQQLAIRVPSDNLEAIDRYVSFFVTAGYTLQQRYSFSASARKDESNLFGVETNKKGVPLYSLGFGWEISKEKFYHFGWLPQLKLRITHGYNGNVNKSVSAYTTAALSNRPNIYGATVGTIINPPNPDLRWEKIQITNIGLDLVSYKNIVSASLEFYRKIGTDLIGNALLDPTTGNLQYWGNVAAMEGSGIDISITSNNLNRKLKWQSIVLFNYARDKISKYGITHPTITPYYHPEQLNPIPGRPLYSVYSLKWLGLDPQTGNPIGILDGHSSQDYSAIINSSNFEDLVYSGPANPVVFGNLRNTFSCKQLTLSFNLSWKAGYFFRRTSIDYLELFLESSSGHPDFALRWKNPGDEVHTNIPSLVYPEDPDRSFFFKYSEILIERGDHIRLQDIQLLYDFDRKRRKKWPMKSFIVYLYANNLGIIWKANKKGIDPDYLSEIPNPKSIALGVKVQF